MEKLLHANLLKVLLKKYEHKR